MIPLQIWCTRQLLILLLTLSLVSLFPTTAVAQRAPACVDNSESLSIELNVTGANSTTFTDTTGKRTVSISTVPDVVAASRIQISLVVTSCHAFNKEPSITQLAGARASAGSSLASAGTKNAIGTQLLGGGKLFRTSVGPFGQYRPTDTDGITIAVPLGGLSPIPKTPNQTSASVPSGELAVNLLVMSSSRPQRDATAASAVSGGSVAVTTTAGIVRAPTAAGAAQRQALLTGMAECPKYLRGDDIGMEQNPLGFRFDVSGDEADLFGPYRGAIVGNTVLIVAFAFLNAALGATVMFIERRRESKRDPIKDAALYWILGAPRNVRRIGGNLESNISLLRGMELVRFPTKTVPVAAALMQGSLSSAFVLAIHSTNPGDILLAIFVVFVLYGSMVALGIALFKPFFKAEFSEKDLNGRTKLGRFMMNTGRWTELVFGDETYIRIMGPLFEDFKPAARHFFMIDLASLLLSSYLLALHPETDAQCGQVIGATVALLIGYALLVCTIRPFMSRALNVMFCSIAVVQGLAGVALGAAYGEESQTLMNISEFLNFAALVMQVLNIIYSVAKTGSDWYRGDLQPDKAMRQVEDTKELLRVERALVMRFAFRSVVSIEQLAAAAEGTHEQATAQSCEKETDVDHLRDTASPRSPDVDIKKDRSITTFPSRQQLSLASDIRSGRIPNTSCRRRRVGSDKLDEHNTKRTPTIHVRQEGTRAPSRNEQLGAILRYLGLEIQRRKAAFDPPRLSRIRTNNTEPLLANPDRDANTRHSPSSDD